MAKLQIIGSIFFVVFVVASFITQYISLESDNASLLRELAITKQELQATKSELELQVPLVCPLPEPTAPLSDWASLDELRQFLVQDATNSRAYSNASFDCDDFAMMLRANAAAAGYNMELQIAPAALYHMINLAVVGNSIYYVYPQTDKIVYCADLD